MAEICQTSIEAIKARGETLIPELLYKLQIASGAGEFVAPNSEVEIKFKVIVRGQTVLESDERTPYVQRLEQILPPGLSIALSTMRRGERALILMDPVLAFGEDAVSFNSEVKIPRNSKLVFEVELISWTEEAVSRLQFKRAKSCPTISHIEDQVELAEDLIKRGRKLQALMKLKQCLRSARSLRINAETASKEEKARQKLVRIISARAAECAFNVGKFPQAVSLSREALEIDRFDAFMNYICGCAYFSLGKIRPALSFVRSAHYADIANEIYAKKLAVIEGHEQLLTRDIDEDSDKEDFEEYAAYCLRKIEQKERDFKKEIGKFIEQKLQGEARRAVVGGGFRPEYIEEIVDELTQNRKIRVICSDPDSFEVLC